MRPIAFDRASRDALRTQLALRQAGADVPVRWHEFLDRLNISVTGISILNSNLMHVLSGQARLLGWQYSPEVVAAAAKDRGLSYVCWGVANRKGWRGLVQSFVLKRSAKLLVNDELTRSEVEVACGRSSDLVPFFIDVDYFDLAPISGRQRYLFCNGINDRDEELLLALANRGHRIIWLVNNSRIRERFKSRSQNLELVENISFADLRKLYQQCAAVLMPARRDVHAAGQTTSMEAIACGTPVIISEGRTASIFRDMNSVQVLPSNDLTLWESAVLSVPARVDLDSEVTASAIKLRTRINMRAMEQLYRDILFTDASLGASAVV